MMANDPKTTAPKRKSIFTDVIHLAGLVTSSGTVGRDSVLDLSVKTPVFAPQPSTIGFDQHRYLNGFGTPSFFPELFNALVPSGLFHDNNAANVWSGYVQQHQHQHQQQQQQHHHQQSHQHHHQHHQQQSHHAHHLMSPLSYVYRLPYPLPSMVAAEPSSFGNGDLPPKSADKSTAANGNTATSFVNKQAPRFQCPDCNRVYSTFSGLSKHRQFHCASQMKRQFGCKVCQKHYTSLGALKMHIRTHTLPCKCELCGKAFSRPWLLQGHVRTHTGEKPFRCLHCGRAFADRSNLRAHLQTHSEVKKYRCLSCQKTFSRMSLLTKHETSGCPGAGV